MSDWEHFLREVSWFLQPGERAVVGQARPWARGPVDGLPELSALLDSATVTPVSVGDREFELLAWGSSDARRGWLCHPPPGNPDGGPFPKVHKDFWRVCGGLAERFGEPSTWWLNQDEVLTVNASRVRVADALSDYAWLWENDGLSVPIDADEFYAVAVEANGNLTLAHREDARLLLFAPDHAFEGVTPLAGCPPYSLLTFDRVPDLTAWIEECAVAWR